MRLSDPGLGKIFSTDPFFRLFKITTFYNIKILK